MKMLSHSQFLQLAGQTDIYLIDQIMKERFMPGMNILDAGCGKGRNLEYFLRTGFEVCGVDAREESILHLRALAQELRPELPPDHFKAEKVESLSFADAAFDAVLSIAVLHFAKDEQQFMAMLDQLWRVLKPGGFFFCRLASSIGIEKHLTLLEGRRYLLPDGSKRFLVDETMLLRLTHKFGAHFLEPLKSVNVQNQRCMTTWVLKK